MSTNKHKVQLKLADTQLSHSLSLSLSTHLAKKNADIFIKVGVFLFLFRPVY